MKTFFDPKTWKYDYYHLGHNLESLREAFGVSKEGLEKMIINQSFLASTVMLLTKSCEIKKIISLKEGEGYFINTNDFRLSILSKLFNNEDLFVDDSETPLIAVIKNSKTNPNEIGKLLTKMYKNCQKKLKEKKINPIVHYLKVEDLDEKSLKFNLFTIQKELDENLLIQDISNAHQFEKANNEKKILMSIFGSGTKDTETTCTNGFIFKRKYGKQIQFEDNKGYQIPLLNHRKMIMKKIGLPYYPGETNAAYFLDHLENLLESYFHKWFINHSIV